MLTFLLTRSDSTERCFNKLPRVIVGNPLESRLTEVLVCFGVNCFLKFGLSVRLDDDENIAVVGTLFELRCFVN